MHTIKYLLLFSVLLIPLQQSSADRVSGGQSAQSKPQKPSSVIPSGSPSSDARKDNGEEKSNPNRVIHNVVDNASDFRASKDWWDKFSIICTFLLVVVGIGTFIFVISQTRSAKQASESAKATVESFISGERAWLLWDSISGVYLEPFESQKLKPSTVFIVCKNFGKTVAKMTAWKFGLWITAASENPPRIAYEIGKESFNPAILPHGDEPLPYVAQLERQDKIIRQQELDDILIRGTKKLWLCGIIHYEDTFRPAVTHKTRFCRRYFTVIPGQPPIFFLDGPDEYNQAD